MLGNIEFTDKFYNAIESIWTKQHSELLYKILDLEKNPIINNPYNITHMDVSNEPYSWNVKMQGDDNYQPQKIGRMIRTFFGMDTFSQGTITDFVQDYHEAVGMTGASRHSTPKNVGSYPSSSSKWDDGDSSYGSGTLGNQLMKKYGYYRGSSWDYDKPEKKLGDKLTIPEFKYNPKNIKDTFISLVTKTYPHGHEEEVLKFLPKLEKDQFGNYFKIIGKSTTMFTCHLDTADHVQKNTNLYSYKEGEDEIIQTDGNSVLGADDKAGVTILLYLMAHNIPGIYYFFIGEERGGIGSHALAHAWIEYPQYKHIKRCVSFDRKRCHSVITSQYGVTCCSDEFGTHLAKELNKSGLKYSLDPTGVYTDSASFMELIPECTNLSVGYLNEHTGDEFQNISHLDRLGKACVAVDWEGLTTKRKVGYDEEIFKRFAPFLKEFRKSTLSISHKLVQGENCIYIKLEMDEPLDLVHEDFLTLSVMLNKHKLDPDILFEEEYIKIELK